MKNSIKTVLSILALTAACCTSEATAVYTLTDVTVYSATSSGSWAQLDIWETRPGEKYNLWLQNSDGTFLNGPTDADARPNITLTQGANAFRVNADPGANYAYFGVNLFFNGASTPSISAVAPMRTTLGSGTFSANSSANTPGPLVDLTPPVPGAGTLSFVSGGQLIALTDFFWASPSVYNQDLVGTTTTGANGLLDYVGGITLSVTPVPEPAFPALAILGAVVCGASNLRKRLGL